MPNGLNSFHDLYENDHIPMDNLYFKFKWQACRQETLFYEIYHKKPVRLLLFV